MKIPIIYDEKDPKWILLLNIFKIIDSRKIHQEFTRNGIKPVKKGVVNFKIVLMSMFFASDISYVVSELKRSHELRKSLGFNQVPESNQIYEFLARFNQKKILEFVIKTLNKEFKPIKRGKRTVLIDGTDIQVDMNWNKQNYTKKFLEKKGLYWAKSASKGFYIGFKLTLALDYHTGQPLTMLIHKGSKHDSELFPEIMEKLRKRRIIRNKDIIIADKGYISFNNYREGILKYKIVPLIFPKENMKINKILSQFNYPLEYFKVKNKKEDIYKELVSKFKKLITKWKKFKKIRGKIEDFFKLTKKRLKNNKFHKYTKESIAKTSYLLVLLTGLIIKQGYNESESMQKLSET
ncbi:transposase-like protein [Methanobrevibacter arboriphilus JCM 13429 = DSM 1125]|uniref:Transposase-like protein n=2 Tax=Methanobrevibacter arboriphilus JCM 13429 = DSM 1125 TaxID=1300164 RepID=A0A1V6N437_METAZ|nr:transposase [Methanobrevibacter arboriphilus]OQD59435.1 transposase-like protein [Methanobrevibacter arboriphilus JCM 13429 = DSM 1125]